MSKCEQQRGEMTTSFYRYLQIQKMHTPYPTARKDDALHFTYLDTEGRPVITIENIGPLTEKHIQDFQLEFVFPRWDNFGAWFLIVLVNTCDTTIDIHYTYCVLQVSDVQRASSTDLCLPPVLPAHHRVCPPGFFHRGQVTPLISTTSWLAVTRGCESVSGRHTLENKGCPKSLLIMQVRKWAVISYTVKLIFK